MVLKDKTPEEQADVILKLETTLTEFFGPEESQAIIARSDMTALMTVLVKNGIVDNDELNQKIHDFRKELIEKIQQQETLN